MEFRGAAVIGFLWIFHTQHLDTAQNSKYSAEAIFHNQHHHRL
jgi:hypothetical protein